MTKKILSRYERSISAELEDVALPKVIEILQLMIEKFGSSATLAFDETDVAIISNREETDEEYAQRLEHESLVAARKESQERAQYEALKTKFENTTK